MKEFWDIEYYKTMLEGNTVVDVKLTEEYDEGMSITFADGTVLEFYFSGCEGAISVLPDVERT